MRELAIREIDLGARGIPDRASALELCTARAGLPRGKALSSVTANAVIVGCEGPAQP